MVLLEPLLKLALYVRLGDEHNFDLIQARRCGRRHRRNRCLFTVHAAKDKKWAGKCSAQSVLIPFFKPPPTLMHGRCNQPAWVSALLNLSGASAIFPLL